MADREKLLQGQPDPRNYGQPPPPYYQQAPQQTHQNTIIVHQAQPIVYQRRIVAPPDYTYLAVIAVICFFPLGLLALYMANKTKESVAAGNVGNAWGEAVATRILSRVSISIGTLLLVLIILAIVLPITIGSDDDD
ncbi:PREDICTED: uncharacterized protein LOC100633377 [Amphimedon queenslandica]|nr:PREDICTED: uncharacterized protein LOC100633377 [Amphimedon queenslandica]|eukprot:XP_003384502.1 PREDICTED: uncharacterized protein LOC100633377 [Amphimedon queenslandica]